METIASFWYGQPAENSTEGKEWASSVTISILNIVMN